MDKPFAAPPFLKLIDVVNPQYDNVSGQGGDESDGFDFDAEMGDQDCLAMDSMPSWCSKGPGGAQSVYLTIEHAQPSVLQVPEGALKVQEYDSLACNLCSVDEPYDDGQIYAEIKDTDTSAAETSVVITPSTFSMPEWMSLRAFPNNTPLCHVWGRDTPAELFTSMQVVAEKLLSTGASLGGAAILDRDDLEGHQHALAFLLTHGYVVQSGESGWAISPRGKEAMRTIQPISEPQILLSTGEGLAMEDLSMINILLRLEGDGWHCRAVYSRKGLDVYRAGREKE
eukprot:2119766-Pyramimonas_sp.AAC.1